MSVSASDVVDDGAGDEELKTSTLAHKGHLLPLFRPPDAIDLAAQERFRAPSPKYCSPCPSISSDYQALNGGNMTSENDPIWTRRSAISFGMASTAALLFGCSTSSGNSESETSDVDTESVGKVIVVGAGPAGLTTAHLLRQRGVEAMVLEAKPTHGGRIRHDLSFVDFPIPLGAEWVHVEKEILSEVVNNPDVTVETELVGYSKEAQVGWYEDGVEYGPLDDLATDFKFVDSSWLEFFDTYVVPGIADLLRFDTQVKKIEYTDSGVTVTDANGVAHEAARVVVTIPLKLLQTRAIEFVPDLEPERLEVIDAAPVWSGQKAFFVFEEEFYPTVLTMPDDETSEGQRLYYDAAYGQDSDFNVLGLFTVGHWAEVYQAMSQTELLEAVLSELDEIFDGAASRSYVRHLVQNWNDDEFAQAAYLADDAPSHITRRLAEPVGDRLFFAGDAYTLFDDWSSVHTATRSAANTVERLLDFGV